MDEVVFIEEEISKLPIDEVEEHQELNYIQQAIKSVLEPIEDDIVYNATLIKVEELLVNGTPILIYKYLINGQEVSDQYFFSKKAALYSTRRLMETLNRFDVNLTVESAENELTSIVEFTQHLIGSEVLIVQRTRTEESKSYKNYEIVEVTKKSTEN